LQINVQLHGILRDRLPHEAKGRVILTLHEGAMVGDVLAFLDIERRVVVSLNGILEPERVHVFKNGDDIVILTIAGGG